MRQELAHKQTRANTLPFLESKEYPIPLETGREIFVCSKYVRRTGTNKSALSRSHYQDNA